MNTEHTNQPRQAANAAFEQWWQRHGLEDPMYDEDRYYITASSWARRGYLAAMQAQRVEPVNQQLLDAIKHCHGIFDQYVSHHLAKPDYDKAAANERHRAICAEAINAAEQAQQAEPVAWEVSATKGDMPRQTKLEKSEAAALAQADHWQLVGCDVAVRGLVYAQADAAQPPAVAVPDGYALVPIKPTDSMLDAAVSAGDEPGSDYYTIYAAMLAAAPQGVNPSVPVADEKECLHHFVMLRNECMKCGQPYDAAQKGGAA